MTINFSWSPRTIDTEWRARYNPASEVKPSQKLRYLLTSDPQRNFQDFGAPSFPTKGRIQTGNTAFNVTKVESCCIGDYLNVLWLAQIFFGARNGRSINNSHRPWDRRIKFPGVFAAILDMPSSIKIKMHQVCQTTNVSRTCGQAAAQKTEPVQI